MQNEEDARRLAVDLNFLEQLFKDAPDDPAGPEITLVPQEIESPNPESNNYPKNEECFKRATKNALTIQMLQKGVMHSENDQFLNYLTDLKAKANRAMNYKEDLVNGAIMLLQDGLVLSWNVEERIPFTDKDLSYFYEEALKNYEDGSQKKEEMNILINLLRAKNDKKNKEFVEKNDDFKIHLHEHAEMLISSLTTSEKQRERLRKMIEEIPSFTAKKPDP